MLVMLPISCAASFRHRVDKDLGIQQHHEASCGRCEKYFADCRALMLACR